MSFQNPVFIPGPTNMPEAIRLACHISCTPAWMVCAAF